MNKKTRRYWHWVVAALLAVQLGLLWLQGAMLNRQHAELMAIRFEIRGLAAALDAAAYYGGGFPSPSSGLWQPRVSEGLALALTQDEERDGEQREGAARREIEESRRSAQDAVKKAKEAQEKVSIAENARKAAEKAEIEKERRKWHRLFGLALLIGAVAYFAGAKLKGKK